MRPLVLTLLVLATTSATASAGPIRRMIQERRSRVVVVQHRASTYSAQTPLGTVSRSTEQTTIRGNVAGAGSALATVNALRASRGYPPFVADPGLEQAALAAASFRAANRIQGHWNDYSFLPAGSVASATGCSAVGPEWGFLSCCQWEGWTYAGAASVMGADGRIYHHLFVR